MCKEEDGEVLINQGHWNTERNAGLDPEDTKPQHMKEEHLRITAEEVVLKQETDASLSPPSSEKPSKLIRNCNSDRGEKSLKCDTCGKRFKFKSTLHIHIRIHTGEKPYVCKTCGKSFTQQGHLSSHILIHTGEKPYVCLTCKKGFLRKKSLRDHMTIHTGEKPYVCKTCGKYFTQQGHLSSHILIHTGEKPYVCLTCKKGFLRKKSLRDHMIIHTGLQPHVCVTCEKGFILKDLTAHIRTHNAEKPHTKAVIGLAVSCRTGEKPDACKRHAKDVQKPSKLKRNCNSDRGEKSLKCDTCGKRFKFKSTLHIHILIHTGEKPYVCKTCGKSFTQQGHLSSHILIHTGEKPYTNTKLHTRKVKIIQSTNYMQSQLHVFWGMSLPCLNIYRL
uniref:C2H2-type domain-containing protein n=1 Tax=Takifugu rubripes TaxID=31033 RepID=A0A674MYZ7_TAKRU